MSALLQQAVDYWLADSPEVRARCAALSGKCVVIEVEDLGVALCLRPRTDGIAVTMARDAGADAVIRARSFDLLRLSRAPGTAPATGRLHIEGDAELAQAVRDLLGAVDFDPEERLARLVGDVPAHEIGRAARGLSAVAQDVAGRLAGMLGEYLKYETRSLPRPDEVATFVVAVDRLRDDVERVEARLKQMLAARGTPQ